MHELLAPRWQDVLDPGYRASEISAVVGVGAAAWERAVTDLLRWRVKTRSGFRIDDPAVKRGARPTITVGIGRLRVREPVEVIDVFVSDDRVGYVYRTLPGHPVEGVEGFVVHRDEDETVLTVRSLTRAAGTQPWRSLFPLLRIAQIVARRRYLRALREPT